ncbi:unnamed protein product [Timema podura]|uniref:Prolyl 4-hydroxylase alpha subunit Fe(2+) 2OG dioxygenase domain-containing protein n=1 Tax=Timema podura TaxID=61482 RepID=A0ABN7P8M1_TIMPD|nr:unnamed protein product [Timema podura]
MSNVYLGAGAILYLNENFEGGEFFFSSDEAAKHIQSLVKPKCGRLVGFSAGSENLHGVFGVQQGRRCALGLWFTHNPRYVEEERKLAEQVISEVRVLGQASQSVPRDHQQTRFPAVDGMPLLDPVLHVCQRYWLLQALPLKLIPGYLLLASLYFTTLQFSNRTTILLADIHDAWVWLAILLLARVVKIVAVFKCLLSYRLVARGTPLRQTTSLSNDACVLVDDHGHQLT